MDDDREASDMLGGASRMSSMTWSISSTSASIETEEALSRLAASAGPLILLHDTHTGSDEKKERGNLHYIHMGIKSIFGVTRIVELGYHEKQLH